MAFDYYGERLVTCSSDRTLKLWSLKHDEWTLSMEWTGHQGSIWQVDWAHPEFGSIIASCSFDRSVILWDVSNTSSHGRYFSCVFYFINIIYRLLAQLVDARESINAIAFAPRHFGLRLATASADGYVRMYEAIDVLNLSHWPLQEEFLGHKGSSVTTISWNKSRFDVPTLVIGASDGSVSVYGYNASYMRWSVLCVLSEEGNSTVHDVSWAPCIGRSYHTVAVTSKDCTIRILKLRAKQNDSGYDVTVEGNIVLRDCEVWKLCWNVVGTVLTASGDDGIVRMFKKDAFEGEWVCVNSVTAAEEAAVP